MKLYFQKLGKALVYLLFIGLLSMLLSGVLATILNGFVKNGLLWMLLYDAVPVAGASIFTYKKRLTHADKRREYLHRLGKEKFSPLQQLLWIFSGKDYIAELAAFLTVLLLYLIPTLLSEGLPMQWFLIEFAVNLLLGTVLFAAINLLLWFLVHRVWASERVSVENT